MQCHECGRAVQVGDRFCNGCGISLDGVTDPTAPIPATTPAGSPADATPIAAAASTASGADADDTTHMLATSELAATELVEQVEGDDWGDDDPVWAIDRRPADDRPPGSPRGICR